MGLNDSVALKLIKLNAPMYNTWSSNNPVSTIAAVGTDQNHDTVQNNEVPEKLTKQWIINSPKYRHLFQGIGKFKINPVSVTLQKDTTPVQKPPQKVPLAMQKAFKEELDSMEQQGIISKYDTKRNKAPEWLNSFVIVKKPNGKLHVCLDPTDLNQYIVRPVCNSLTLDEIVDRLKGAVFFAVFNTTKGFFHIPMDADSQLLTAMLTPYGIYIYNVLAMGLADATDIFETVIRDLLKDLNGVLNIADDVLVFGNTYDSFRNNVISFLDHCVKEDIHLNPDKIQIDCEKVPFFGHTLSKDGVHPDKAKVDLIQNWPIPQNVKELQSFLGTVNYLI